MSMQTDVTLFQVIKTDDNPTNDMMQIHLSDGFKKIITKDNHQILIPMKDNIFHIGTQTMEKFLRNPDEYIDSWNSNFENWMIEDIQIVSQCNPNFIFSIQFVFPEYELDTMYAVHFHNGLILKDKIELKYQYADSKEKSILDFIQQHGTICLSLKSVG